MTKSVLRPASRLLLALLVLSGPGGCKGSNLSFPVQNISGTTGPSLITVSGTAFDGPVTGGTVAISQYQADGSQIPLGSTATDRNGNFTTTTLVDTGGGPVLFTMDSGQTTDLSSGAAITFSSGESLATLLPASDLTRAPAVLTPFSTLETAQAQTLILQGESPVTALGTARSAWNQFLGFDPAEIPPSDLTAGPASANASGIYGLLMAGLSELTNHIGSTQSLAPGTANPMGLLPLLVKDMGDGVLNGITPGNPTPLVYYGYTLSPETLRKDLTAEALIFLWSAQNQSGLTPALTDGILNGIALNTGPLFPSRPTPAVPDPGTPAITIVNPVSGLFYNGTITVQASATDSLGIAQMVLTGQNIVIPGGSVSGNPLFASIDTTQSPSGPASLSVVATDYAGTTRTESVGFTIDNTPPTLGGLSPANGAILSECTGGTAVVTVTGTLTDTLSGPEGVKVTETSPQTLIIGVTYTPQTSTTGQFQFSFSVPANGCRDNPVSLTITGYDNLQNSITLPYALTVIN